MRFWPYERLKIHTALSSEAALQRLADVMEPERASYLRLSDAHTKPYQGSIVGFHFEITRPLFYNNALRPVIEGDVQPENTGCSIYITMQPQLLVVLLMIVWLVGTGLLCLGTLVLAFLKPDLIDSSFALIPAGLFAVGYLIFLAGFKFESIPSKSFLQELFQAKEVEEPGITHPVERAG